MTQVRQSTSELIADEEKKGERLKARMAELKDRQRVESRRRDTYRKIVAGAGIMAHIKIDPRFRKAVQDALNKAVPGPKHRGAIPDLLDEQAFQEALDAERKAALEAKEAREVVGGAQTQPAPPTRPCQNPETGRGLAPVPRRDL